MQWREEDEERPRGFDAHCRAAACNDIRPSYAASGKVHLGSSHRSKDRAWEFTWSAPCAAVEANRGMNKPGQELLAMLPLYCPSSLQMRSIGIRPLWNECLSHYAMV